MKKQKTIWMLLVGFLLSSLPLGAEVGTEIQWLDKTCFRVGPFQTCKPSTRWDTQQTKVHNARYKWVLHRGGANPECHLRFDENPVGKTAHQYAQWHRERMVQRGLTKISQRKQTVAGRNVTFIAGLDQTKGFRHLMAVWRTREVGINFECTAEDKDFAAFEPQFMSFMTRAHIVSEDAL